MNTYRMIAYCETGNLPFMTEEDIKRLDGIHIAFGLIEDGLVVWEQKTAGEEIRRIRTVNPEVKIILSIGGWAADGFSQAACSVQGREKLAASAVAILREAELDGLDIDWEFPGMSDAGIESRPEDKENFTLLLQEFRCQLDGCSGYKTLSIAASGLSSYVEYTNMQKVQEYLDYVQLMTYDFHCGFHVITGHLGNLYPYTAEPGAANADETIRLFVKAGVPIEKIVMGAAFYGRIWEGVPDVNNGLGQKAAGPGEKFIGYHEADELARTGKDGYRYYFDEEARASYLFNGNTFITYEDKKALEAKAEYVRQKGMYGMMYWEYRQDATHSLTGYFHECLNR